LLGDDEDTGTSQLHDRSAEIGNAQNQLSSTNRALETVKTERVDVEQKLAEQAAQLSSFQTQLSSAKSAYETETRLLETLRDRYASQNTEIKKLREDLITAESDVSALRAEKSEVQGNLLRDKDEVRDLQKKMASTGAEIETLRVDIEKAKKDAKQQKGLLAIAKKQLATRETEKAKVESELQDARTELNDITKEQEETETELAKEVPLNLTNGHNIPQPLSLDNLPITTAQSAQESVPSPPASVRSASIKSTNPFDRLAFTGTPRSESPFLPFTSSPTGSTMPNQSIAFNSPSEDPFGFPTAFAPTEEPRTSTSETAPSGTDDAIVSTPKPGFSIDDVTNGPEMTPMSDSDDLFSTPPSTAVGQTSFDSPTLDPSAPSIPSYLALDAAAANFPDLIASHPPGHLSPTQNTETDLNSVVKELDVDDTDSSEESEEVIEQGKPTQPITSGVADIPPLAASTFDDTFGVSPESPQPVAPSMSPSAREQILAKDINPPSFVSFEPPSSINVLPTSNETVSKANGAVSGVVTGKNAFDEAMSTIPAGHTTTTKDTTFDFDSAFDDNFDFAAAKAQAEKPLSPPRSLTVNEVAATSPAAPQNDQFDSVFGVAGPSLNTSPSTTLAVNKGLSFDDAFGPESSNTQPPSTGSNNQDSMGISFSPPFSEQRAKALAFDTFSVPKTPPVQPTSSMTSPAVPPSGTASLLGAPNTRRPASPLPDLPPRQVSPKARPGFSDKPREPPPTRHSRLSVSHFKYFQVTIKPMLHIT
jgi:epidermal growth factor receptor substrate 15